MYCLAIDSRVLMTVQNCQRKGKNNARLQCWILKRNDEKKDLVTDAALSLSTDMARSLSTDLAPSLLRDLAPSLLTDMAACSLSI